MCSILCYTGKDMDKELWEESLERTSMRGPDAAKVVETDFGYLGFARLAIMGLSEEGDLWLSYAETGAGGERLFLSQRF